MTIREVEPIGERGPRPTPEERWDRVLLGHGRAVKTRSKLIANSQRNWLIAVTALACAKADACVTPCLTKRHCFKGINSLANASSSGS